MAAILLETASGNLLLGFMPESLGLLVFGVALVVFAVGLRRVLDKNDERQAIKKVSSKEEEAADWLQKDFSQNERLK